MELFYHHWSSRGSLIEQRSLPLPLPPKITLLHGIGGTGAIWRPIGASLENEMSVLALDQRGHGQSRVLSTQGSPIQPGFTPLDYGQDVIDTLESLNFHPSWLLGHSMGVRSAVAAAYIKPHWIQGLILVDLGFSGVAGGGLGESLSHFLKVLPPQFSSREAAKTFMASHCPDPSIGQYLMAVSVVDSEGHLSFPFDHWALIQTIEAAQNFSVRNWIKDLGDRGMPILVLRGEKSLVWNRNEFKQEREQFSEIKSIVFKEIAGAGHGLPFEQRTAFVSTIREFIKHSEETPA